MKSRPTQADEDAVYAHIGRLLVLTQHTEQLLRFLFKEIGIDPARVSEPVVATDKRTLGMLIKHLRSKATLNEHFDEDLSGFLRMRNEFVHSLANEEWFDPGTEEGWKRAWGWMSTYQPLLYAIQTVLVAFIRANRGDVSAKLLRDFESLRLDPQWDYPELFRIIETTDTTEH